MPHPNLFRAIALLCLTGLSACGGADNPALTTNSGQQIIRVDTPGMAGARCVLQNGSAAYTIVTPGNVAVQPHDSAMRVTCFKGDYMQGGETVMPTFAPREAAEAHQRGENCTTCRYPAMIHVAMSLNTAVAKDITVRQIR